MIATLCRSLTILCFAAAILALAAVPQSDAAESFPVSEISKKTHVHGIAVDPRDPSRIYLATHHGFFVVGQNGMAIRLSETQDDFMGFTPHPTDSSLLYASGHPASGGNLGIITSSDGGRSWRQLAKGFRGPVDFHQMDVSKADPSVIFGIYGELQVSRDGGRSWKKAGSAPKGTIDIAASARDADTVYAATQGGIVKSTNGGKSWVSAYIIQRPTTMIEAALDGSLYAFQIGTGLLRASEPSLNWRLVNDDFGDAYIVHLAVDPSDGNKLYAVTLNLQTRAPAIVMSPDGGATWKALGGD